MPADPFGRSPLFTNATKALQDAARRQLFQTDLGRMLAEAEKLAKNRSKAPYTLRDLAERYRKRISNNSALRDIERTEFGRLATEVERYAAGGGSNRKLLDELFKALGPAGDMLKALVGPVRKRNSNDLTRELSVASRLLRAFGFEVFAPPKPGQKPSKRKVAAAQKILEAAGYPVDESASSGDPPRKGGLPFGISPTTGAGSPRKRVTIERDGQRSSYAVDDPVVTGAMVRARSSNVYAYGYDIEAEILYIRFKAPDPQNPEKKLDAEGPLYAYHHVPPQVFQRMHKASSKGNFVWDNIRIRGTVSGHRFDYALVGVTNGYVPRKATMTPGGEWFLKREVRTNQGNVLHSRAAAPANPLHGRGGRGGLGPSGPTTRGPRGPSGPRLF